jgi:hypothetical protein
MSLALFKEIHAQRLRERHVAEWHKGWWCWFCGRLPESDYNQDNSMDGNLTTTRKENTTQEKKTNTAGDIEQSGGNTTDL